MAKRTSMQGTECPVARSVEAIGDGWSLLIVRDAFDGIRRFGEFQRNLGMAKNILSARLRALVANGIFDLVPASDGSAYQEYVLTEKGRDVFPVVVALIGFANRHLAPEGASLLLAERGTGRPITPIVVDAMTLQPVTAESATVIAGPRASNDLRERLAARQAATQARSY